MPLIAEEMEKMVDVKPTIELVLLPLRAEMRLLKLGNHNGTRLALVSQALQVHSGDLPR